MARRPPSTQWGSCDRPLQHDADAQPGPSSSPGLLHLDPGDGEQTSVVDMASIGVRAAYNLEAAAALVPDSTELDRTQLKCTSHLAMASTMLSRSSFTALARSSLPLRAAPLTAARATAVAFAQQKTSFATSAPTMAQQGTSAGWPIAVLSQEQVSRVPLHSTLLFAAKKQKNLSFETIAQALGRDEVACAALFYGQAKASDEDMANLSKLLEIPLEQLQATEMTGMPDRGRTLGDLPPKEPLIYRLFEIVQNYGYAYKAVLNEKFGDGIMSAITFSTHVEKETDEKGDWVKITLRGKWLPYSRF